MTPRPTTLPPVSDMGLCQLIREAARILHNCGGADRGAGYSEAIAQRIGEILGE